MFVLHVLSHGNKNGTFYTDHIEVENPQKNICTKFTKAQVTKALNKLTAFRSSHKVVFFSPCHGEIVDWIRLDNQSDVSLNNSWRFCNFPISNFLPDDKIASNRPGRVCFLFSLHRFNHEIDQKNGKTLLHLAAECGNRRIAKFLVLWGADVDAGDKKDSTPLHLAAQNRSGVCEFLVESGADLRKVNKLGWNALHFASWSGNEEGLKFLLSLGVLDVNAKSKIGETPLTLAGKRDNVRVAKILIEKGAKLINSSNIGRETRTILQFFIHKIDESEKPVELIMQKAANFKTSNFRFLLQNGADPRETDEMDRHALHVACEMGMSLEKTKVLLDLNVLDVNAACATGDTPLILACRKRRWHLIELLLAHGVCPEHVDGQGWTALHHVVRWDGPLDVVKYLVESANSLVHHKTIDKETVLHVAARSKSLENLQYLIICPGADVQLTDSDGRNLLHWASARGLVENVRCLMPLFPHVDIRDSTGSTSLLLAAAGGHAEAAKLLIDEGADVNSRDKTYATPLLAAARGGDSDTCRVLLDAGADVTAEDESANDALIAAFAAQNVDTAKFLFDSDLFDLQKRNLKGQNWFELVSAAAKEDPSEWKYFFGENSEHQIENKIAALEIDDHFFDLEEDAIHKAGTKLQPQILQRSNRKDLRTSLLRQTKMHCHLRKIRL
ncbi:ankyrin-3-like isoform X2 [Neocloeon triangulifer]|nr:ankyrin-3-like isoform X2 [Neocloeon triangulifer]